MTHREDTTAPLLPLEEFFSDPAFARPLISPDGERLAYLAPAHGRRNVWVRGREQSHEDAVCVTHDSRRGITDFEWTEDSRWLLYQQDTDGNEDWHLFRADPEQPDAEAVDLTPLAPGSRVVGVDPHPGSAGEVLVWMNRRPMIFDVFRVDVRTGETIEHVRKPDPVTATLLDREGRPRFRMRITETRDREFSTVGSDGDGSRAADGSDATTGASAVVPGAQVIASVPPPGHPMGVLPTAATPDGSGLLIGSYQDGDDLRLVRVDAGTGAESIVAGLAGHSLDVSGAMMPGVLPPPFYVSARTGEVIAARFVGDRPVVRVVDPAYADVFDALVGPADGVLGTLHSDASERWWVATFVSDREPGVGVLLDRVTGRCRELFRAHPDRDPELLARMRSIALTARDGLPLHGFLTLPVGATGSGEGDPGATGMGRTGPGAEGPASDDVPVPSAPLPMVVLVHGGPWMHDMWGSSPEVQFLANRGYAVLQVNFRGSTGYGRNHLETAIGEFAGAMHDDVVDAVRWAVERGIADPGRVGIMGGSYGGYEALVGVTVTPDLFAAAVDYVGISDLAHFMASMPAFVRQHFADNWFRYVGDPDDPAQLADMATRSPITMVDRIRTPLLVAQGANDVRVVRSESDDLVGPLRERGVPVEYIVADDEGHGFENPENQLRLHRAVERHFARHLGGRAEEVGAV
jgi:dipeptidyl aminopeptidase/acylaminoacyl peptidase